METNNPELIYEQNREKTRVLISGSVSGIAELVLHTLDFTGTEADYILENGMQNIQGNDFLILENHNISEVGNFQPIVVLIANETPSENYTDLLNKIVSGGILIYDESDENLKSALSETTNYFRRIPYKKTDISNGLINTEFGEIPVSVTDEKIIPHIEGVRLLCQQFRIMEEEFYESLMSFR